MVNIELVIKIQEHDKAIIDRFVSGEGFEVLPTPIVNKVIRAVRNGTPLPKGHGDLKDVDELLKMTKSYKSELGRLKADPFVKCGIETVERFIKEMSPIIEADKQYGVEIVTRGKCMMCGKELDEGLFFCPECEAKQKARTDD